VHHDDEPTLRDLIELLRRGLVLALAAAVLAAVATFFISRLMPPTFEARAGLVASMQDPNQRDFGTTLVTAPALEPATYQAAIRSRPVLASALQGVTGTTPTSADVDDLEEALTVRVEDARASSVLRVSVRDQDPERAARLANAIASAAVHWDEQRATRSLETIIESLQAQIAAIDQELAAATDDTPIEGLQRNRADLQLQLSSARALRTAAVGRLELLEGAEVPRTPVAPRPLRNATLAGLLAVFLVYGLLLLRDALDTRVRDLDELVRITDVPVLAEFPRTQSGRRAIPAEAASYLRTGVTFATNDAHPKVVLVTSALAEHGKSTVSIALAESFARQHYRTILLDADLRKPVLGREYGLGPFDVPSLRDTLESPDDPSVPARLTLGREVELDVIPSFEAAPDPSELLAARMPLLIEQLRGHYDVIVIDSAPVLPVADALTVAPHCTGVLVAVSAPDAERRAVSSTVDLLRRVGVRVIGSVATNVEQARRGPSGYGYGYGSGYGASEPGTRGDATSPAQSSTSTPARASRDGGARPVSTAWSSPTPGSVAGLRGSPAATRPGSDQPAHDAVTPDDLIDDSVPAPRVATATRDG
jgi:polysaccharide biosynthesis transport protein